MTNAPNQSVKPTVYIAGPMRGYTKFNFPMFDYASILGEHLGYRILSPADMDRLDGFDPETNSADQFFMKKAITRDIDALLSLDPDRGDFVALLPGWQASVGARAEAAVATWLGLPLRSALSFTDTIPAIPGEDRFVFLGRTWNRDGDAFLDAEALRQKGTYTIRLVTPKGDNFDLDFTGPPNMSVETVSPASAYREIIRFLLDRREEVAAIAGPQVTARMTPIDIFASILGEKLYGHPRFYEILLDMARLHSAKNHDYAGTSDPLKNLHLTQHMGIAPWKGVTVRLGDKWSRLAAFAASNELLVKDESVVDTFTDTAVYAILGRILYEESRMGQAGRSK